MSQAIYSFSVFFYQHIGCTSVLNWVQKVRLPYQYIIHFIMLHVILLSRLNVVQKETMWSLILYVVCSMYVVCVCMYVVIFAKLITVSTYIDVFPWDLDTMILGHSHTCDLNRCGVKGHLGVNDLWFKF